MPESRVFPGSLGLLSSTDVTDLRHTNMHTVCLISLRKQSTINDLTFHSWDEADPEERKSGFRNESEGQMETVLQYHSGLAYSLQAAIIPHRNAAVRPLSLCHMAFRFLFKKWNLNLVFGPRL